MSRQGHDEVRRTRTTMAEARVWLLKNQHHIAGRWVAVWDGPTFGLCATLVSSDKAGQDHDPNGPDKAPFLRDNYVLLGVWDSEKNVLLPPQSA